MKRADNLPLLLKELFIEQSVWKTEEAIQKKLKRRDIKCSQSSISRALKEIGAIDGKKDGTAKGWYLDKQTTDFNNLRFLKRTFSQAVNIEFPVVTELKTMIIRTKPCYNVMLAKKIKDVFITDNDNNEVISVICADDTDVIVYYKTTEGQDSNFEKSISKLYQDKINATESE